MNDAYKIFRQIQEKDEKSKKYNGYEKEDLIDEIIELQENEKQLQNRIDKAIEYIENEGYFHDYDGEVVYHLDEEQQEEIIKILKGKSE